jgi:hypothetical protein
VTGTGTTSIAATSHIGHHRQCATITGSKNSV